MSRDEALASGRFKRAPNRWQTDFGRWVADVGVPRVIAVLLATICGVSSIQTFLRHIRSPRGR